jgi:glycosyltransferase involved in cell wall biosynthesis
MDIMGSLDSAIPSGKAFRAPPVLPPVSPERRSSEAAARGACEKPKRPRVMAVMPAYNAALTLERTINDIPPGSVDEVLLVDDCSRDDTIALARRLGIRVIEHRANRGYGGNQKTCYAAALETKADIIVMIHPDYQYDSRVIPHLVGFIELGICDVMLGSRIRTRREAIDGGMPLWKYIANRGLTVFENVLLGQNLGDFHSGLRAYRREVLETIPFQRNSDDFVFDTQFLVQCVHFGFKLGDVPVPVRYFKEASSINFRRSTRYGVSTLVTIAQFWAQRFGARLPMFERSAAQARP